MQDVGRILIVDDDDAMTRAVAGLLSSTQAITAASLAAARAAMQATPWVVGAVLDLGLPDGDGRELFPDLAGVPCLVLTGRALDPELVQSIAPHARLACKGAASLREPLAWLESEGRRVERAWVEPRLALQSLAQGRLTSRELDVGRLIVVQELDREEIAEALEVGLCTVKTHIKRLLEKCGLHGQRAPALRRAVRAEIRRRRGIHVSTQAHMSHPPYGLTRKLARQATPDAKPSRLSELSIQVRQR
ncbi:MAG: LuxR C-terminal-related transcriptional regulator [Sandaracinaceae bacterium]|nr:LuxR C-terminal-related transcriptional regulator [Sandaracinaceae bacterium]